MKQCIKCNHEINDEAMFCPECGASQNINNESDQNRQGSPAQIPSAQKTLSESGTDAIRVAQNISEQVFSQVGKVFRWEKVAYIGACMTAIAVLLPLVSVSLIAPITAMVSISQMLSFIILAFSAFAAYYASEGKYNISISIHLGILVTFSVIYYKLYTVVSDAGDKLKELNKINGGLDPQAMFMLNIMKEYADKIIGLGMGVYFLLVGAGLVMLACAACRLSKRDEVINIGSVINEIKIALLEPAEICGQKIPGFIITIIAVLLLIFVAMNIEIFGFKVSAMI